MEWIINQLRVHPELAIFPDALCRVLAWQTQNREILLGDSHQRSSGRSIGRTTEYHCRWSDEAVFFLLFLFAVGYKVGPQFFRGLKKDYLPQVGFAVLMCIVSLVAPWILYQNHGISCRRSCRTVGRLTNNIRRYRRGKRYDQPAGNQRCTESHVHQCNSGSVCRNLYFRNYRFGVDSGFYL